MVYKSSKSAFWGRDIQFSVKIRKFGTISCESPLVHEQGILAEFWQKIRRNFGGMGGWLGGMGGWLGRKTWHFFRFLARRYAPTPKIEKNAKQMSAEFWITFLPKIRRKIAPKFGDPFITPVYI